MKKQMILSVFLVGSAMLLNGQTLTLDEILASHFKAIGMDKLAKVNTITMIGKQSMQGMELPFVIKEKRPGKILIVADIQGTKFMQGFDGVNGWMVAPWTGSTDPQDIDPETLKSLKEQADLDGVLFDWKEKGHQVELVGMEPMEGTDAYKLKVTTKEGDVEYFYLDADAFVIIKNTTNHKIQDAEVETESFMSNYKNVDGIMMPYTIESKMKGQTISNIVIDSLLFDKEMSDSLFIKPSPASK
jgi:hypothetical protein